MFKKKYEKYKDKYQKLQNYYNLFKDNYQTAGNINRTNEYCYLTGKKFEDNDFVSQCNECKNWGLVSEIIKSNNCKYCNSNLNNKFSLTQQDIYNIIDLLEDKEKDIVDIGFEDLKFNYNDDDNDNETIEIYNKRLLGNDELFNKSYQNYIDSNNPELRHLLLDNLHILVEQIVPDEFLGTYTYHNNNHTDNTDEDNCLYCIYNKIL